jgi:DNA-binding GntR family transcriptional regulator
MLNGGGNGRLKPTKPSHAKALKGTAQPSDILEVELHIPKQSATLRGLVEEKLRLAISAGKFRPGQRLIERELCETLGVGRTSVREALRQLEAEGLITVVPHRGPTVSTMSVEEAKQLYAMRALLEGYAGKQCAALGDEDFKTKLDHAVEEFARIAEGEDRSALVAAKEAFYGLLLSGSGNSFVGQALTGLHNRINMLRFTTMMQPGRIHHSIAEIREIAAAIRASDGNRAEKACRTHIEKAAEAALAWMNVQKLSDS